MCGIAGAIFFRPHSLATLQTLAQMAAPLQFRGPDGQDFFLDTTNTPQVALAHNRLSIIDLSDTGRQPMQSLSKKAIITFNGEIYNYQILKNELLAAGRNFRTHSDTEVLLEGYEHWGMAGLLERIDGMFAFALYCYQTNTLFLARDRFGKKPLYYYHDTEKIAFSSDIRSFDALGIEKKINLHSVGYFLTELSTPAHQSIWENIHKLPPAHSLKVSANSAPELRKYWTLAYANTCTLSTSDILKKTDDLLTQAVAKRLVADVPVAAQLSGGVDSSLVVAKMARLSDAPIATYSVGFEESTYNELPFARAVAQQYKTNHHELILRPQDIGINHQLIREFGEPFADASMLPSYLIAQAISKTEKVVCGGDGGDELFAGYYTHYITDKVEKWAAYANFAPLAKGLSKLFPNYRTQLLAQVLELAKAHPHTLLNRNMGFSDTELAQLTRHNPIINKALQTEHARIWESYQSPQPHQHLLKKIAHASLETRLLSDYLVKVDRATMFASLEMRSPFLDKDLAAFAFSLSPEQWLRPHGNKSILKQLAENYIPKSVIYRQKQGFAVPIGEWFRGQLKEQFQEVVFSNRQDLIELDYSYAQQLFDKHLKGENQTHKLWALYVFHVWANNI